MAWFKIRILTGEIVLDSLTPKPDAIHNKKGAQWLSGRVLDSRPKGRGFEPHRRHCVVSLSKTHLS